MRLIKKIKFKRAKEIAIFKKVESAFQDSKLKNENCKNPKSINFHSDISELNFFLVIDYINLINEKINYNKIFPSNPIGENAIIDFNNLVEEQRNLKNYIEGKQHSGPEFFKNLGFLNEVVGCYFVATTHRNFKKIKNFNFKNKTSKDYVCCKFDYRKKLPIEFEKMCHNFSKDNKKSFEKESEEFRIFLSLSEEEQDGVLDNMLNEIQFPEKEFIENENDDINSGSFISHGLSTATTIQFAAEQSIDKIFSKDFLANMLFSAEEKENYELCAKIRDRIIFLNK